MSFCPTPLPTLSLSLSLSPRSRHVSLTWGQDVVQGLLRLYPVALRHSTQATALLNQCMLLLWLPHHRQLPAPAPMHALPAALYDHLVTLVSTQPQVAGSTQAHRTQKPQTLTCDSTAAGTVVSLASLVRDLWTAVDFAT